MKSFTIWLALILASQLLQAEAAIIATRTWSTLGQHRSLEARQQRPDSTCGFYDGNANAPRTAEPGFNCRVDVRAGIWGFCPVNVINARDCGLAGACIDNHQCIGGCGIPGNPAVTTFVCTAPGQDHCSTARLIAGPDQTFDYLACAGTAALDILLDEPTTTKVPVASSTTPPPALRPPPATVTVTPPAPVRTEDPEPEEEEEAPATTTPPRTSAPVADDEIEETASNEESSSEDSESRSSGRNQAATTNSTTDAFPTETGSSNSTSPDDGSNSSSDGPNNLPAIIGGAVGGFAILALICFGIWYILHKRRQTKSSTDDTSSLPPSYWQATPQPTAGLGFEAHGNPIYEKDGDGNWYVKEVPGHVAELPGQHMWRNTNSAHPFEMPATPLPALPRGANSNVRPIRPSRAWNEGL